MDFIQSTSSWLHTKQKKTPESKYITTQFVFVVSSIQSVSMQRNEHQIETCVVITSTHIFSGARLFDRNDREMIMNVAECRKCADIHFYSPIHKLKQTENGHAYTNPSVCPLQSSHSPLLCFCDCLLLFCAWTETFPIFHC